MGRRSCGAAQRVLAWVVVCGVAATRAAVAADTAAHPEEAGSDALLAATLGQFNFVDEGDGRVGGGLEYRWAPLGRWKLAPGAGLTVAETGAMYGYASLHCDLRLGRSWYLTPVLGAGLFRNTDALDLGHAVEFKTGLEISMQVPSLGRIGLAGYHLSNAGLSTDNPGTEVLELVFALPLGRHR